MNQEPYRFYPYWQIVVASLALPWLFRRGAPRRSLALRAVLVVALAATAPATIKWSGDHVRQLARFSEGERIAFGDIARHVPRKGLVLTDTCIPRRVLKVMAPIRVADITPGLALPERFGGIRVVLDAQWDGYMPSGQELHAAGISSYVAATYCLTVDRSTLVARFGPPVTIVRAPGAVACGMPSGTAYEIYDVRHDRSAVRTAIPGFARGLPNQFRSLPDGRLPQPNRSCGYWFSTGLPVFPRVPET